jgi:hypothetical protein
LENDPQDTLDTEPTIQAMINNKTPGIDNYKKE